MSEVNWRLGHLDHLQSPFGNAGGVVKKPEEVRRMALTGTGWIEGGSYTNERRFGNDRDPETGEFLISEKTDQVVRVWNYNPDTGEMDNSLGMPNDGKDKVLRYMPDMLGEAHGNRGHKPFIANVAPVSSDPVTEIKELVQSFYEAKVDGIIVNGGCPNVVEENGGRHEILTHNPSATRRVLNALGDIGVGTKYPKVFIRVSPQSSYDNAKLLYRHIEASKMVSAVFVPNSWPNHRPTDNDGDPIIEVPGGFAGLTGPATAPNAFREAVWAADILNGSGIQVVLSGGIMDFEKGNIKASEQIRKGLKIGALAAGSTFFYVPRNGWEEDVDE